MQTITLDVPDAIADRLNALPKSERLPVLLSDDVLAELAEVAAIAERLHQVETEEFIPLSELSERVATLRTSRKTP